jgi:hypothetical protein
VQALAFRWSLWPSQKRVLPAARSRPMPETVKYSCPALCSTEALHALHSGCLLFNYLNIASHIYSLGMYQRTSANSIRHLHLQNLETLLSAIRSRSLCRRINGRVNIFLYQAMWFDIRQVGAHETTGESGYGFHSARVSGQISPFNFLVPNFIRSGQTKSTMHLMISRNKSISVLA